MENSTPNLFKQRILLLLVRFLIAVAAPLIIFAIKWEVFRTKEALGGFGVFCFASAAMRMVRLRNELTAMREEAEMEAEEKAAKKAAALESAKAALDAPGEEKE